jgi:tetratricopeptide (TPR) repeat protein
MTKTSERALTVGILVVALGLTARAGGNPESERLRIQAYDQAYNLDRDEAIATLKRASAADGEDPGVYRALASVTWLDILFRRGVVTVDDYIGHLTSKGTLPVDQPPPALAATFHENAAKALAIAERQVRANPNSPDAHYNLGSAVALQATYSATAEGQVLGGLRAARRAYNEHERVLELDPKRKDASFIVGTYRYIVSQLPLPLRWVAYIVGFGGGKERGLKMIEEAAAYPSDTQADAKFELILLYNREQRYADALRILADMRRQFPRNRLLWLESGATALRGGRPTEAEALLIEGFAKFNADPRPRSFGEEALWCHKLGVASARLGRSKEAEAEFSAALAAQGRDWVYGRTHAELGKLAALAGDRARARREYQIAVMLGEKDNDPPGAAEARALLAGVGGK